VRALERFLEWQCVLWALQGQIKVLCFLPWNQQVEYQRLLLPAPQLEVSAPQTSMVQATSSLEIGPPLLLMQEICPI
jgi:hypothetical protein